jgi:hypothetical protein
VVFTSCDANVRLVGLSVARGASPTPVRLAVCELPGALSVTVSAPFAVPMTVGKKLTWIVQLAPALNVALQRFESLKGTAVETLVIFRVALPVFVRVTVCWGEVMPTFTPPKFTLAGLRLATGPVPVPLSPTTCGLPTAESAMLRLPVDTPDTVGLNVTLTVQLEPAARDLPQVLAC